MNTEKKILTKKDHERDQIVVQEFANEAVRHQLRISDYRAEGFGGLFIEYPKIPLKWKAKPTILTIRSLLDI